VRELFGAVDAASVEPIVTAAFTVSIATWLILSIAFATPRTPSLEVWRRIAPDPGFGTPICMEELPPTMFSRKNVALLPFATKEISPFVSGRIEAGLCKEEPGPSGAPVFS